MKLTVRTISEGLVRGNLFAGRSQKAADAFGFNAPPRQGTARTSRNLCTRRRLGGARPAPSPAAQLNATRHGPRDRTATRAGDSGFQNEMALTKLKPRDIALGLKKFCYPINRAGADPPRNGS